MKKVLIINGHPDKESLCTSLADSYFKGASKNNANAAILNLYDLEFAPILEHGYRKRTPLEPDLEKTWQLIKEADHLVFVYPNWWGTYPALLKGFFDRVFLPGLAFQPHENSIKWDKLLKGKTARVMVTMDSPGFYYRLWLKSPGHNSMKRSILNFVGVQPVRFTNFRMVKAASSKTKEKWIARAYTLGERTV